MTDFLKVSNDAISTLASGMSDVDSLLTVVDGSLFPPSGNFHISIDDEILNTTERNVNVLAVERGAESTTPVSHLAGAYVRLNITSEVITQMQDEINTKVAIDGSTPFTDYIDVTEATIPATPATNNLRLYNEVIKGFSFFSFKDDTGMVRKLVRDSVFVGRNMTGSTIAKYRAVYASGSSEQVPTLALAKADSLTTMPCIGITVEAITASSYGRVMQVGLIEDANTNAFDEGDIIYVSATTAGAGTNVPPTYPNVRQEVGTILVKSATVGAMQVVARSILDETIIDHAGLLSLAVGDPHTQYVLESYVFITRGRHVF